MGQRSCVRSWLRLYPAQGTTDVQHDFPDGLLLRTLAAGHTRDRERLPELYRNVFLEVDDWDIPDDDLWVENMLGGLHPTIRDENVWLIVDPARDELPVATLLLSPERWRYETIPLGVGRIEMVATHPEYRRRGLMRALMATAHERSNALGHMLQAITGIPHIYRRFGYTMAVALGRGASLPLAAIPVLKPGAQPFCSLRPAVETDFQLYGAWDEYLAPQFALSAINPPRFWTHWLTQRPASLLTIIAHDATPLGYVALWRYPDSSWLNCELLVVGPESSLLATFNDVLRGIRDFAQTKWPGARAPEHIGFMAGYPQTLATLLEKAGPTAIERHPYAWYLRASDLAQLLLAIRPVLESRLEHSGAHRYSGELKLSLYNMRGLRLSLEEGRLTQILDISVDVKDELSCDAWMTQDVLLNLIVGDHSFAELRRVLPETRATGRALALLEILFPPKPSYILALN